MCKPKVFKIISWWWKVVCIKLKSALIKRSSRTHRHHHRIYYMKCSNKLFKKPKAFSHFAWCARVRLCLYSFVVVLFQQNRTVRHHRHDMAREHTHTTHFNLIQYAWYCDITCTQSQYVVEPNKCPSLCATENDKINNRAKANSENAIE